MKKIKLETAYCKKCNFTEKYEPNEFGMNYYQAIGECPNCGHKTFNFNTDKPTKVIVLIRVKTLEKK